MSDEVAELRQLSDDKDRTIERLEQKIVLLEKQLTLKHDMDDLS